MTVKTALSVLALAAGMAVVPAMAQSTTLPTTIGSFTVPEAEAGAVKARCDTLRLNADTQSLVEDNSEDVEGDADADSDENNNETAVAGDATVNSEPALTDSPTATTIDLAAITLEDCEAGGWFAN
jgi:hypothetical protein